MILINLTNHFPVHFQLARLVVGRLKITMGNESSKVESKSNNYFNNKRENSNDTRFVISGFSKTSTCENEWIQSLGLLSPRQVSNLFIYLLITPNFFATLFGFFFRFQYSFISQLLIRGDKTILYNCLLGNKWFVGSIIASG